MERKDLIIGVHGAGEHTLKERFGSISAFSDGLKKGFEQCGVQAYSVKECIETKKTPHLTIGFQAVENETWQTILNSGRPNIMWAVDSVFWKNTEYLDQFASYNNFVVFNNTPCDNEPIGKFFPMLKHAYVPVGVDLDLWKKNGAEKDIDVLFMGQVEDYEAHINHLKETMPELVFGLMNQIYELAIQHSALSFWQIFQILEKHIGLKLDIHQYLLLFRNVEVLITNKRRIDMIKALDGVKLKVFGNELWKKYLPDSAEYMGECDYNDSVDIVNQAKILLSSQPFQHTLSIPERIFNASAVETFVLSNDVKSVELAYGDNLGYFTNADFSVIKDKINYFLEHEEERQEKAKNAYKITAEKHTWKHRADAILQIVEIK